LILLDTSGLLAAIVEDEPMHGEARRVLEEEPGPRILSPFVLAELDYLLASRGGVESELLFLDEVAESAYDLPPFDVAGVSEAREVIAAYADQEIGLADASIVVLAGRYETERVLTLDERHFRALRSPRGRPFSVLPADA
jgi:uncharacterized protein